MSEPNTDSPISRSPQVLGLRNTIILGIFIVVAAVSHAVLSSKTAVTSKPLHVGTVVGEILVSTQSGVTHHKCNGCKIECYESFVVVYVDRAKVPTWSDDYVLTYPWSKIVHLTMADPKQKS